jgi:hypothetical protein
MSASKDVAIGRKGKKIVGLSWPGTGAAVGDGDHGGGGGAQMAMQLNSTNEAIDSTNRIGVMGAGRGKDGEN